MPALPHSWKRSCTVEDAPRHLGRIFHWISDRGFRMALKMERDLHDGKPKKAKKKATIENYVYLCDTKWKNTCLCSLCYARNPFSQQPHPKKTNASLCPGSIIICSCFWADSCSWYWRKQAYNTKSMRFRVYDINEFSRATGPWSGNRNNNTRPSRGICFGCVVITNHSEMKNTKSHGPVRGPSDPTCFRSFPLIFFTRAMANDSIRMIRLVQVVGFCS